MAWAWMGVFAVVAIAAAAQTVSGFGFALIAMPAVAVLAGPKEAVVGLSMVAIVLATQLWLRSRGHIERRTVLVMTVAATFGMPVGLLILDRTDDRTLTVAIAATVIVLAVLLWTGLRLPTGKVTDSAAGLTAGIMLTSTGTNGPPIVIALSSKQMTPPAFRGTISAIFLVQGIVALGAFALGKEITSGSLSVAAAGLPGLLLGSYVGEHGFRRLDAETFRRIVFAMLVLSGVVSLIGALAS